MVHTNSKLENKVAIVTGSTSGIGAATAQLFAKHGAKVVVVGRRKERGERLVNSILQNGGKATFIQTDITKTIEMENMVDQTLSTYNQIDILVNNAGKIIRKEFADLTINDWDDYVRLNAFTYFRAMQLVLPHMVKRRTGNIVNVTSAAAVNVRKTHALYSFTKAGITHMSKIVAAEYADKGIRVNCLLPGIVDTEMIAGIPDKQIVANSVPLGRMSTASEQAKSILYLASDDSSFTTGTSVITDGGVTGL